MQHDARATIVLLAAVEALMRQITTMLALTRELAADRPELAGVAEELAQVEADLGWSLSKLAVAIQQSEQLSSNGTQD